MSQYDIIVSTLTEQLKPGFLKVENESHMHNVPVGSESHFKVQIVAAAFIGKRSVQQHQMVYAALGDIMGQIHALALHTWTPEQWQGQEGSASPLCMGAKKGASH